MPDSTTDDSDLKTRVDRLEEVCREQQETIQKLMPSRRSVLAGAAGLGIGAASMSATSGSAAAQSAAGQVGTDSDRVDVKGATVDTTSLQTETVDSNVDHQGNDINNVGALEADDIDITPVASGEVVISAGGDVTLDSGSEYRDNYHYVATALDGNSDNNGSVQIQMEGGADGTVYWRAYEESGTDPIGLRWAIIKVGAV